MMILKRSLKAAAFNELLQLVTVNRENAAELNKLVDDFHRLVTTMSRLGDPVQDWDTPLVAILSNKLDKATLCAWQQDTRGAVSVTYQQLHDFLIAHIRMLRAFSSEVHKPDVQKQPTHKPRLVASANVKRDVASLTSFALFKSVSH